MIRPLPEYGLTCDEMLKPPRVHNFGGSGAVKRDQLRAGPRPDGTAGSLWFPMLTANDVWRALSRERVKRRLEACQARLRQSD